MKTIFATTLRERVRGLHAYKGFPGVLVLVPCRDIHTYGMKTPIDVAFIARDGRVVKSFRDFMPRRRARCPEAVLVLERYANTQDWPAEGERIRFDWSGQLLFDNPRKEEI